MSTTRGQRRGIQATVLSVLALLLTGVLLTAGAPRAAAETTQANAGHARQLLYIIPEQGYVELLLLEITGDSLSGSALTDVYNCGDDQVKASWDIPVLGTVTSRGYVDLRFVGIPGTFVGFIGPRDLELVGASGDVVQFPETSITGLRVAIQDEPPVWSISGYTCADLPATYWP
jgi:hypothetical protein